MYEYLPHLLIQFALLESLFLSTLAVLLLHLLVLLPVQQHLFGEPAGPW